MESAENEIPTFRWAYNVSLCEWKGLDRLNQWKLWLESIQFPTG